jgi:hypothetical protein
MQKLPRNARRERWRDYLQLNSSRTPLATTPYGEFRENLAETLDDGWQIALIDGEPKRMLLREMVGCETDLRGNGAPRIGYRELDSEVRFHARELRLALQDLVELRAFGDEADELAEVEDRAMGPRRTAAFRTARAVTRSQFPSQ